MPLQCPLIVITMSTSKVLKELNELKVEWKKQNLTFTPAQKDRYAELLNKRREIVKQWYKDDKVASPIKVSKL